MHACGLVCAKVVTRVCVCLCLPRRHGRPPREAGGRQHRWCGLVCGQRGCGLPSAHHPSFPCPGELCVCLCVCMCVCVCVCVCGGSSQMSPYAPVCLPPPLGAHRPSLSAAAGPGRRGAGGCVRRLCAGSPHSCACLHALPLSLPVSVCLPLSLPPSLSASLSFCLPLFLPPSGCLPRGVEPLESAYPPARTHARMHARTREHIEVVSILKCMHSTCDRMLSVEARARAKGSHLAPRSLAQWCIYVYVYI